MIGNKVSGEQQRALCAMLFSKQFASHYEYEVLRNKKSVQTSQDLLESLHGLLQGHILAQGACEYFSNLEHVVSKIRKSYKLSSDLS